MKTTKTIVALLTNALLLLSCACSRAEDPQQPPVAVAGQSKVLVVYFSRAGEQYNVGVVKKGNTAFVAEEIAKQTGADLFEIKPKKDVYPKKYDDLTDYAKTEQRKKERPEYVGPVPNLKNYDVVFVGAPVWWGDWPMIMYSFFEKNDLAGKTLAPFCTHEGSGLSGFDKKLAKACPKGKVTKGFAMTGKDAQKDPKKVAAEVSKWLENIKVPKVSKKTSEVKAVKETSAIDSIDPQKEAFDKENVFGQGNFNAAFAQYFIGDSFLKQLTPKESSLQLFNVTFEPGCRNNWHIHHASKDGGQILVCTAGEGWYQAEGEAPVELKPGVTVYIPANVKHWHGAKKDKWFSHIAIEVPGENGSTEWLEPVSDEAYNALQ